MALSDLLAPDAILPALKASSKKQALQDIAERAAGLTGLSAREIFDLLLQRERLGSTGVGNGIAIPHGKIAGVKRLHALLARLDRPIDFDAPDGQPVDLIVALIAPEGAGADHLKALSKVARAMRDPVTVQKLRAARDADGMFAVIAAEPASHAA